ncbi:MAG: phosphopyruvate hydratase [Theionarchaea archaeon]|nr:phosphopyruvate hydratase [Theionarchaea archaeon]
MKITKILARQIIDSRGNPTVEVDVYSESGWGRAAVPSGASTGIYEALELRDGTRAYHGKGVKKAVQNVTGKISKAIIGKNVENQKEIDDIMIELDGTKNKSNLGANAILAVSLATARCAADSAGVPLFSFLNPEGKTLPVPLFNIINGGAHAPNNLDFQEFMIAPVGADTMEAAVRMGSEMYHELEKILGGKQPLGDEGGFAPQLDSTEHALDVILTAIDAMGYNKEVKLALDCAPSYFYEEKSRCYRLDGKTLSSEQMVDYFSDLINTYPLVSIEDPLFEKDYEGFQKITTRLGDQIMLVGDDLFVTSSERLREGIQKGMCNALLLKVNQIGTLTEALDAARIAFDHEYNVVVSHRSGETEDTFIAHLAVALNCGWIKTGAPARGERTAKYNELLRIEEILGNKARYGRE